MATLKIIQALGMVVVAAATLVCPGLGPCAGAMEPLAKTVSRQFANLMDRRSLPAIGPFAASEARRHVWLDLADFAFALAEYKNDHGGYPAALGELSPKYVHDLPKDPFSEQDYRYRREGEGYLLYSVGFNGKDDGGRTGSGGDPAESGDDIAIRTPDKAQ